MLFHVKKLLKGACCPKLLAMRLTKIIRRLLRSFPDRNKATTVAVDANADANSPRASRPSINPTTGAVPVSVLDAKELNAGLPAVSDFAPRDDGWLNEEPCSPLYSEDEDDQLSEMTSSNSSIYSRSSVGAKRARFKRGRAKQRKPGIRVLERLSLPHQGPVQELEAKPLSREQRTALWVKEQQTRDWSAKQAAEFESDRPHSTRSSRRPSPGLVKPSGRASSEESSPWEDSPLPSVCA
ncbi:hypothetical protein EJ06DRAFT_525035 [Trichodelitschia bisporula]|uniref:Uncharacterized protein n=1 Tax=Trichodelitschia bisporula TaxID=703511 RepID=A0A6G1HJS8_9PEZI|nr:hypothetical protein EJ06DRAFT_525035 [Trichodelitschia bisporula]